MLGHGDHLAAEQPSIALVLGARLIAGHQVDGLVIRLREQPLARAEGLKGERSRCNVEIDPVPRAREQERVAAIGEILQQDRDLAVRGVVEAGLLRRDGVQEALRGVRYEVGPGRVEVQNSQVASLDVTQLGLAPRRSDACEHRNRETSSRDQAGPHRGLQGIVADWKGICTKRRNGPSSMDRATSIVRRNASAPRGDDVDPVSPQFCDD